MPPVTFSRDCHQLHFPALKVDYSFLRLSPVTAFLMPLDVYVPVLKSVSLRIWQFVLAVTETDAERELLTFAVETTLTGY